MREDERSHGFTGGLCHFGQKLRYRNPLRQVNQQCLIAHRDPTAVRGAVAIPESRRVDTRGQLLHVRQGTGKGCGGGHKGREQNPEPAKIRAHTVQLHFID
jgi:hypothetical protein